MYKKIKLYIDTSVWNIALEIGRDEYHLTHNFLEVHSKSKNIENITRTGDILICAIGKPNLVTQNWVKPGAIIIDVGINKILINNEAKIVGDMDFKSVSSVCQAITPVPGGVGPVTVAMLLANTLEAYKLRGKA